MYDIMTIAFSHIDLVINRVESVRQESNLKTRPCLILPSQRLLNSLSHSNTILLPKPTSNNLYTNRHTIHQIDIICNHQHGTNQPKTQKPNIHCSLLNLSPAFRGTWSIHPRSGKSFSLETLVTGTANDA